MTPISEFLLWTPNKTRINARDSSSISSPQVNQMVIQNDRANSRDCSGIGSPQFVQNEFVPSVPSGEFLAPCAGDKMGSN